MDEKERASDPFFLFLSYNAPHWPLHAHPEDIVRYEGVYDDGYEVIRKARYQNQLKQGLFEAKTAPLSDQENTDWSTLSEPEKKEETLRMQIHAAMVDRMDQNIGRLIEKLCIMQKLENTLICFLVDNGSSHEKPKRGMKNEAADWGSVGSFEAIGQSWANVTNSPFRKWKAQGMEGGICTPMIAHWPAGIKLPKHSIYREPCHLIDWVPTFMKLAGERAKYPSGLHELDGISLKPSFEANPTLCELSGLPKPKHLAGRSFVPLLDDPNKRLKKFAISQFPNPALREWAANPLSSGMRKTFFGSLIVEIENQIKEQYKNQWDRELFENHLMGYTLRTDFYRLVAWLDYRDVQKKPLHLELYDHRKDPQETVNIATEFPEKANELLRKLLTIGIGKK